LSPNKVKSSDAQNPARYHWLKTCNIIPTYSLKTLTKIEMMKMKLKLKTREMDPLKQLMRTHPRKINK